MHPLVAAALRYQGVRFVHRGRLPHKLDCVGLIWRAFKDCGVELPCPADYGREPHLERFMSVIVEALGPDIGTRDLQPGDVVTMKTDRHPHHLAIVTHHPDRPLGLVHASSEFASRAKPDGCVMWHGLSPSYFARIVTVHRRPV